MARIRTIKPEFWTSEQIVECSLNARLLFIGLWNFCDDNGIHRFSPKTIKMEIFPGDEIKITQIENWLDELKRNGLIKTYHVENKQYLIVTGWHHQKIDRPNPKHPLPEKFDDDSTTDCRVIDEQSPPEGKRSLREKESKGKGKGNICKSDFVFSLPASIDKNTWKEFVAMRERIKKPLTPYAAYLITLELEKIRETHNHDPVSVLNQSIKLNYHDVYPLKNGGINGNGGRHATTGGAIAFVKKTGNAQSDGQPWPTDREY